MCDKNQAMQETVWLVEFHCASAPNALLNGLPSLEWIIPIQVFQLSTSTSLQLSCKTGDVLVQKQTNKHPNGNAECGFTLPESRPGRTAAPRRSPTKVRRLPARLVLHASFAAAVIYNREPLGKASPLLTFSQAVHTLFRSLFRNAANDPQHGNSSFIYKKKFL